jgi:hypothetical protein
MSEQPNPTVPAQKSSRLVVKVFGVIGAVAEGPAAIAGLVCVILILGVLVL